MITSELTAEKIIPLIAEMQSKGTTHFDAGLFPSERFHTTLPFRRADNNIFLSALVAFTLQNLKKDLPAELHGTTEAIIQKVRANYPKYQSKYGLKTYNYWQTFPPNPFPNGWYSWFRHFELPEDADDTALIYLTGSPNGNELNWLQNKLIKHANSEDSPIRNTFKKYRQLKAYSVWFGKNMPIEFDVCVHSNILYLLYQYQLPQQVQTYDTLSFIRQVIENREYLTHAYYIAPCYQDTSVIIYHLARLIGTFKPNELVGLIPQLIEDIHLLMASRKISSMQKLLLANSLFRLGEDCQQQQIPSARDLKEFPFFSASLLKPLDNYALGNPSKFELFQLKWRCEAYNYCLLLEHLVLVQKQKEYSQN